MSNSAEQVKTLALFRTPYGIEMECGEWADSYKSYARLSEFVTVTFPYLPIEARIKTQLDSLQESENSLRIKFQEALDAITNERGKLLALTNQTEESKNE